MSQEEEEEGSYQLKRSLKKRHLLMLSLGGTIGTGLFIGIADPLATVGPLGTIFAYLLAGAIMLSTMLLLAELSCAFPHAGSFQHYALMFMPNPIWSYLIGWLYWLSWVLSMAADLTAASLIANLFFPQIPIYLFSLIILIVLTLVNLVSARTFGELEYWLSAIKVFAIVLFILVGAWLIYHQITGGTVMPSLKTNEGWFPNGFFAIFACMAVVTYSFQGIELVGNAAGETAAPHQVLPKVIMGIAGRIILFYVFAIIILALIYPYNHDNKGVSPFVWVFEFAGIRHAGPLMLLVIFSAALSAANSAIYASSRIIWSMANDGLAPKIFGKVNKDGVPTKGILFIALIGLVSLFAKYVSAQQFYLYLIASTGQVGCLAWIVIAWCQFRFRQEVNKGHYPQDYIRFRSPFFPWLALISIGINILIIVGLWFSESGKTILVSEICVIALILLSYPLWRKKKLKLAVKI